VGAENRGLLLALQAVVGRLHARRVILPDQLLFSLILFPWAVSEFDLTKKRYKGKEFHRFFREIRKRLDEILGSMSIRREHKESIAMQFAVLPQFIRYEKENSWPKWLKKKSYYRECDLFFRIFSEATGGRNVPDSLARESVHQLTKSTATKKTAGKRKYKKRPPPGPAFTNKKRGSIFGLK
jgi:poly(A) polymerase